MENLITIILGTVCIIIGILNRKGNVSMLHSYHRNRVSEENILPFGKLVGLGMIVIGIALIVAGGLHFVATASGENAFEPVANVVLIVGFASGLGISFYAMFKYNNGIF